MAQGTGTLAFDKDSFPSFNMTYGTEIVRLDIGPQKKIYRIHQEKLLSKIPSMINQIEEERDEDSGEETTMEIPEGNIVYWDMLMKWVYHNTLPELVIDRSKKDAWNWNVFGLYALADELDISELKDMVVSALQAGQAKTKMWHRLDQLDWTWAHTKPGCGMRHYLAISLVRSILVYKDPKNAHPRREITVPTAEISELLIKHPDLLEEVLDQMRGRDGVKAMDPRIMNPCEFHEHWPRKKCGYDGDEDENEGRDKSGGGSEIEGKPATEEKKADVRFADGV